MQNAAQAEAVSQEQKEAAAQAVPAVAQNHAETAPAQADAATTATEAAATGPADGAKTESGSETEWKPITLSAQPASGPAVSSGSEEEAQAPKRAFPAPAPVPTQTGPSGLLFDYNDGCRVLLPNLGGQEPWRVRLRDADTDCILFDTQLLAGGVLSSKKFYVPIEIEAWIGEKLVMRHAYDAKGKPVLIQFPVGTLGDMIAWFTYADRFQKKHQCQLTCAMSKVMIELFSPAYPNIEFITPEEVNPSRYYATYNIGLFFNDTDCLHQPTDFRFVGLHRTAGYILGVDPTEEPPMISLPDESRPIPERYVCIAAQSTTQSKYWNNPTGWREIVKFLKDSGFRVICIDQKATHGNGVVWNHIPFGAEDQTGDKPLAERARWLKHADFFVGLSSGLSWLAWAMRTPVVMISGFTHPTNEFNTPFRVINWHTCNSCWNDPKHMFDHKDFMWCPRWAGTPRQFECTRLIQPKQVSDAISQVPAFAERQRELAEAAQEAAAAVEKAKRA
jgi:autotransporter strand-loop-strand O-heptosyltransferase